MIKLQFVLDCVTTILTAVLCFLMLFNKFELKSKVIPKVLIVTLIIVLKMSITFLQVPVLNCISSFLMSVLIICMFYKCQIITSFIYAFLFLMIALVSDVVGVLIVSTFYNHTIIETIGATDKIWNYHIWDWLLQIFLSRIAALIIHKKETISVKWHELLFYIILLIFETAVFACVSNAIQEYMNGNFLIIMMLGFLILDIYIMYILHKVSLSRETEQKIHLMQQQGQLQLQMYQELRKKYNTTCEIAHDINRHILSLKALIKSNPNKQAECYLSDLTKDTERLRPVIKNQNAMLEIILNTVAERCEKDNISLEMNVEDFPLQFISDIDITTIFSNLFDNAIEACMELSKSQRKIHIVLRMHMGLIVFE